MRNWKGKVSFIHSSDPQPLALVQSFFIMMLFWCRTWGCTQSSGTGGVGMQSPSCAGGFLGDLWPMHTGLDLSCLLVSHVTQAAVAQSSRSQSQELCQHLSIQVRAPPVHPLAESSSRGIWLLAQLSHFHL